MKLVMILLLSGSFMISLQGHQQEMHQHITREAFRLLEKSFPDNFNGLDEMANYLGMGDNENLIDPVLYHSIGALKIVAGAWFADEYDIVYHYGSFLVPDYNNVPPWLEELIFSNDYNTAAHTTVSHFWNADQGENSHTYLDDTIVYGELSYDWELEISRNAMKKMRKYVNGEYNCRWFYADEINWGEYGSCLANDFNIPVLFDLYHGTEPLAAVSCLIDGETSWEQVSSPVLDFPDEIRKGIVYNLLGRMCHLLQDMSVPAHAHNTSHAGIYGMYSDFLESNEMEYHTSFQNWNADQVSIQYGDLLNPYQHSDPLYYLMYFLNQIADFYPDGVHSGDSQYDLEIPGLEAVISSLTNNLEPDDLNDENCLDMYNILIPYAVKVTAGLLYWFAVESDQIEQIPPPCLISGNVILDDSENCDEITVTFDKLNSPDIINIPVDPAGDFSYQFSYDQTGYYDIVISKNGYYPGVFENVYISEDLDLGENILTTIPALEHVLVSRDQTQPAFRDIKSAVQFLQRNGSGTIYVSSGTYSGVKNRNIHWYPINTDNFTQEIHISINALQQHSVIMDCEGLGPAFVFNNDDLGFAYNSQDKISGLVIRNAVQGVIIENGAPVIENNIIENCFIPAAAEFIHGAGICCLSAATISDNIIRNNVGYWNGDNNENNTYGGGIYLENNTTGIALINSNQVLNCRAQEGGAIYCTGSGPIVLSQNLISSNSLIAGAGYSDHPGNCEGIYCFNCDNITIRGNTLNNNLNSQVNGGNTLYINYSQNISLINNTISDNLHMNGINLVNCSNCVIKNNLLTGNEYGIYCWVGPAPMVDYCNFWENSSSDMSGNLEIGDHNLFCDPHYQDQENSDYDLEWSENIMSSCIDNGDPLVSDPDGSPSDLGASPALWHDHHVSDISSWGANSRYRWISFPVLDRYLLQNAATPQFLFSEYQVEQYAGIKILSESEHLYWDGNDWSGDLSLMDSKAGYKISVPSDIQLPVSGFKLHDSASLELHAGKNWIGYFLTDPMGIQTAFEQIWDQVVSIASEDWFFVKEGAYPPERCSLIYGKSYVIEVSEDCSFNYDNSSESVQPRERSFTNGFNYNESPVYSAIVIDELTDPQLSEIGVFMGDVCIGAASVEDLPLQILTFLPQNTREQVEVSFNFYRNDRSFSKPDTLYIYNENADEYQIAELSLEPFQQISVRFDNKTTDNPGSYLLGNHPNPFNPETTIRYSLDSAGPVKIIIYNLKGQVVRTLVDEIQAQGNYHINWNGVDDTHQKVSSGLYFVKLSAGTISRTKKMLLLK